MPKGFLDEQFVDIAIVREALFQQIRELHELLHPASSEADSSAKPATLATVSNWMDALTQGTVALTQSTAQATAGLKGQMTAGIAALKRPSLTSPEKVTAKEPAAAEDTTEANAASEPAGSKTSWWNAMKDGLTSDSLKKAAEKAAAGTAAVTRASMVVAAEFNNHMLETAKHSLAATTEAARAASDAVKSTPQLLAAMKEKKRLAEEALAAERAAEEQRKKEQREHAEQTLATVVKSIEAYFSEGKRVTKVLGPISNQYASECFELSRLTEKALVAEAQTLASHINSLRFTPLEKQRLFDSFNHYFMKSRSDSLSNTAAKNRTNSGRSKIAEEFVAQVLADTPHSPAPLGNASSPLGSLEELAAKKAAAIPASPVRDPNWDVEKLKKEFKLSDLKKSLKGSGWFCLFAKRRRAKEEFATQLDKALNPNLGSEQLKQALRNLLTDLQSKPAIFCLVTAGCFSRVRRVINKLQAKLRETDQQPTQGPKV